MVTRTDEASEPSAYSLRYDRLVWRGGLAAMALVFAVGLTSALLAPTWAWVLPAAMLLLLGLAALPRRAATPLLVVLVVFGFASDHSTGLKPKEILFAMVQAGYIAWWFWTRVFVYDEPILKDAIDALMMAFLLYIPLSLALTVLFGGSLFTAASECLSLSMLSLYFPIREMITSEKYGVQIAVGIVLAFGAIGTFRVLGSLREALSNAEYAWQVAQGRVPMNESLLYSASLLTLCLSTLATRWRVRAVVLGAFTLFTLGMIMTQWRAYYVGWAIAIGAILLWGSSLVRWRALQIGVLAAILGGGLAVIVLGETALIAVFGIAERVLSIGSASSSDISLLNRFVEYRALWPVLMESPILGHGPGVNFGFFDAIFKITWVKTYPHNTYLLLWFKFGLIGLVAFLGVWGAQFLSALRLRREAGTPLERTVALFVAAALVGLTASSIVSVTLVTDDTAFNFAMLFALSGGLRERARRADAP